MKLTPIDAQQSIALMQKGARLIDIRENAEYAREHIAEARNMPLSKLSNSKLEMGADPIIFHCKSGNRTTMAAASLLQASGGAKAYVLQGGIEAWKRAGLPIVADQAQSTATSRPLRVLIGGLALAGAVFVSATYPVAAIALGVIGAALLISSING